MAELAKKLLFKKNGVEQTAKAYSTTAEAGAEYIPNKIDGVNCYVAIGDQADSRATVGKIKKSSTAAERAILNSGKLAYTEMSWTTPGTYTFTVPAGVTRIRVACCGGGGGCCYMSKNTDDRNTYHYTANTGSNSSFGSLISAAGGSGGSVYCHTASDVTNSYGGLGGSPNGNAGNYVYYVGYDHTKLTSSGGAGFSLSFSRTISAGGYGNGGYAFTSSHNSPGETGEFIVNAGGGSGGYNTGYFNVTAGSTYSVVVGTAADNYNPKWTAYQRTNYPAKSGFLLIAFGGDI